MQRCKQLDYAWREDDRMIERGRKYTPYNVREEDL